MPEFRIGEIVTAVEFEVEGEKRIVIDAKVTGDVTLFLKELEEHGLTIFLTQEEPLCGIKGQPSVAYPEVLTCGLKKGHKGAYHKSGRFRWIGSFVAEAQPS